MKTPKITAQRIAAAATGTQPTPSIVSGDDLSTTQENRKGKVQVSAYFNPDVRRQLKTIAVTNDKTVQDLLGEALNDLFAKHGYPEIVTSDDQ